MASVEKVREILSKIDKSEDYQSLQQKTQTLIQEETRIVKDFPIDGINFVNFMPMLAAKPGSLNQVTQCLSFRYREANIDGILAIDARGFIFGAALAYELRKPFIAVRKAGKLPPPVEKIEYKTEYSTAALEIESDLIKEGQNLIFIDDILATGGTYFATQSLVEKFGGQIVEAVFLGELSALGARQKMAPVGVLAFHDFVE